MGRPRSITAQFYFTLSVVQGQYASSETKMCQKCVANMSVLIETTVTSTTQGGRAPVWSSVSSTAGISLVL